MNAGNKVPSNFNTLPIRYLFYNASYSVYKIRYVFKFISHEVGSFIKGLLVSAFMVLTEFYRSPIFLNSAFTVLSFSPYTVPYTPSSNPWISVDESVFKELFILILSVTKSLDAKP